MSLDLQKLPSLAMKDIALRAKARRKHRRMSQKALAERSGVSFGSIQRFEQSGQIALEALLKVAFTLECVDTFEGLFPLDTAPKSLDDLFR